MCTRDRFFVWVKMWVKQRMRDGYSVEYWISPPAVLPKWHGLLLPRNSALSWSPYNSGCQIAGKYQTATPYKPCCLRRAMKNIRQPPAKSSIFFRSGTIFKYPYLPDILKTAIIYHKHECFTNDYATHILRCRKQREIEWDWFLMEVKFPAQDWL